MYRVIWKSYQCLFLTFRGKKEGLSPQPRGTWILNAMTAMAQLLLLLTLRSVAESLQVT